MVLDICLFALSSSFHACLQTACPGRHCQLAVWFSQGEALAPNDIFPSHQQKSGASRKPRSGPSCPPPTPSRRCTSHGTSRFLASGDITASFICLALVVGAASYCVPLWMASLSCACLVSPPGIFKASIRINPPL